MRPFADLSGLETGTEDNDAKPLEQGRCLGRSALISMQRFKYGGIYELCAMPARTTAFFG
jgi:hypothetical protein